MSQQSASILVTGSHRSGTTWAGKMLSATHQAGYIHEPFNPNLKIGVNPKPFKYYFQHICQENQAEYDVIFDEIIHFHYPFIRNVRNIRNIRNLLKIIQEKSLSEFYKTNRIRALIKDPIAFFSAEWMHRKFEMDVLVMIRHPAAFCSSLKLRGWKFDFNTFLEQPLLMEKYLYCFEENIKEFSSHEKDLLEQSILLWNIFHLTIQEYQKKYDNWLFVRHEDLSRAPVTQFQSIYKKLDLNFTYQAKQKILESSGAHNPSEQQLDSRFKKYSNKNVKRSSLENIKNWKNHLSQKEINLIRSKTEKISSAFYSEQDWQ